MGILWVEFLQSQCVEFFGGNGGTMFSEKICPGFWTFLSVPTTHYVGQHPLPSLSPSYWNVMSMYLSLIKRTGWTGTKTRKENQNDLSA